MIEEDYANDFADVRRNFTAKCYYFVMTPLTMVIVKHLLFNIAWVGVVRCGVVPHAAWFSFRYLFKRIIRPPRPLMAWHSPKLRLNQVPWIRTLSCYVLQLWVVDYCYNGSLCLDASSSKWWWWFWTDRSVWARTRIIITFNYDGKSMVEIETMENGSMVVSLIEEVFQLNCTMTIPPN